MLWPLLSTIGFGVLLLWVQESVGATWFVYKPNNPLEVAERETATFRWEYSSSIPLVLTQWLLLEDNDGFSLIAQRRGSNTERIQYTTVLAGRVRIDGKATLHLEKVKTSDSRRYGCELTFQGDVKLKNVTRLVVHTYTGDGTASGRPHFYWLIVGVLLLLILLVILYIYLQHKRRRLFNQRQNQEPGPVSVVPDMDVLEDGYKGADPKAEYDVIPPLAPQPRNGIREHPRDTIVVLKVIGKGAFGVVAKGIAQLGNSNEGTIVALKMLRKNATKDDKTDFVAELNLMKTLDQHSNVIALYGYVTESEPAMMIIEFVPFGDLLGHLRKSRGLQDTYFNDPDIRPNSLLTSRQLFTYAWHIANGMEFLASKKIIHRDLAARNVLIGEGEICKITDFGLARNVHQDNMYTRTSRGRLPVKWTAYESLLYGICTTMSDVWSYGIVLYEIFTIGGSPYPKTEGRALAGLLQDGYRMPKPKHLSGTLYGVMTDCWKEMPEDRPTFTELRQRVQKMSNAQDDYVNLQEYDATLYENLDDLNV